MLGFLRCRLFARVGWITVLLGSGLKTMQASYVPIGLHILDTNEPCQITENFIDESHSTISVMGLGYMSHQSVFV